MGNAVDLNRISQSRLLISHSLKVAARFGAAARQMTSHKEVLPSVCESMAKALQARRVTFYLLDRFGNLTAHTSFPPEAKKESHVQDIAPEGPLETVIAEKGFVYILDIQNPSSYFALDGHGNYSEREANNVHPDAVQRYTDRYGKFFEETEDKMDMVFGCLAVGKNTFGAFKIDSFPSGLSDLPRGLEPEDLLSITAIVSNVAAQSLDELNVRRELLNRERDASRMFITAQQLLMGIKHAFAGRLLPPIGYLDLVLHRHQSALPPKANEYLEKARGLLRKLDTYVGEYVEPVKTGSFEISIKREPSDIIEALTIYKSLGHEVVIEESFPKIINTDGEKVKDIIAGLIENAKKYSSNGSDIQISAKVVNGSAQISVTDQGLGLTPEQIEKIFDGGIRFHPDIQGSGWGLNIFRMILKKLGGSLRAKSPGLGQGSTFTLTLPLERG
jgi:signal transduction histidine kinase